MLVTLYSMIRALKLGGFDIGISLIMQNNIILVRCGATDFYVLVYPMKKMYRTMIFNSILSKSEMNLRALVFVCHFIL